MSMELAQDEDDAEGRDAEAYDLEALAHGHYAKHDEEEEHGGIRLGGRENMNDDVVFEIGDEDEEGAETPTGGSRSQTPVAATRKTEPSALGGGGYEITDEDEDERGGLMGGASTRKTDKRMD